jgi:outer membrane protein W
MCVQGVGRTELLLLIAIERVRRPAIDRAVSIPLAFAGAMSFKLHRRRAPSGAADALLEQRNVHFGMNDGTSRDCSRPKCGGSFSMRRLHVVSSVVMLLVATTVLAQNAGSVRLSAFLVDPADTPFHEAFQIDKRTYGGAIEYFWKSNLSWQMAVSSERTVTTTFTAAGLPFTNFENIHPLDGTARFHFGNSFVQPFLGAGARYIRVAGHDNWRPELTGGLTFAITPHLGIDVDARALFNRRRPKAESLGLVPVHDGDFEEGKSRRLSAGLGWRF